MLAKPAPQKWKHSEKRRQEERNLQTRQTKGGRGAKGKQVEVAEQETEAVPGENRETENEVSPDSDEAGEKGGKSD